MNSLRDRHLPPDRGRVYLLDCHCGHWAADYRASDGVVYGTWADSIADAQDWIRFQAEATR